MAEYETEEEQVEAIKAWWKKNGGAVTTGIVVGIAIVIGWKFWQNYQLKQSTEASYYYEQAITALQEKKTDTVLDLSQKLITDYASSNYAALTSLLAAKASIDQNKPDDAIKYLQWVVDHAPLDLAAVARIRLARVLIAQGKAQQAIDMLAFNYSEQVMPDVEEVKGDAYQKLGKLKQAKEAYQKAILMVNEGWKKQNIEMKMDNLSV